MDMSLGKLRELVMDREARRAVVHGVPKGRTWLSDWTELNILPVCSKSIKLWYHQPFNLHLFLVHSGLWQYQTLVVVDDLELWKVLERYFFIIPLNFGLSNVSFIFKLWLWILKEWRAILKISYQEYILWPCLLAIDVDFDHQTLIVSTKFLNYKVTFSSTF